MLVGILAVILGFVSGLFWLWIFVRQDKYEPEPKGWITLIFIMGMLSIIPAIILELLFEFIYPLGAKDVVGSFIGNFFGVGPIEEVCKFLAVLIVYWNKEFDEPMDGIVYSTSAALGFATLENIFYMLQTGTASGVIGLFFLRFFLSTLAHIFFAAMWGYRLGMRKAKIKKGVFIGLILAAFLHGLYNFMLTQIVYLGILIIPLMITMWLMMRARVKHALRVSPHREGEIKLLKCPSCGELIVHTNSHFCPVCGNRYEITDELVFACPRCKTETTSDSTQCSNKKCGLILSPVPHSEKIFKKKEKTTDTEKESIIDKLTTDDKDDNKAEDIDKRKDPASWDEGNSS